MQEVIDRLEGADEAIYHNCDIHTCKFYLCRQIEGVQGDWWIYHLFKTKAEAVSYFFTIHSYRIREEKDGLYDTFTDRYGNNKRPLFNPADEEEYMSVERIELEEQMIAMFPSDKRKVKIAELKERLKNMKLPVYPKNIAELHTWLENGNVVRFESDTDDISIPEHDKWIVGNTFILFDWGTPKTIRKSVIPEKWYTECPYYHTMTLKRYTM